MAEIEIRCAECDSILDDANLKAFGRGDSAAIFVNPCKKCMDDARADGYDHRKSEEVES